MTRRLTLALVLLALPAAAQVTVSRGPVGATTLTLLDVDVSDAMSTQYTEAITFPGTQLAVQGRFVCPPGCGGGGGPSVSAWIQTTLDAGATWMDIGAFNFASTGTQVTSGASTGDVVVPSDGDLPAGTYISGVLGDRIRMQWSSSGSFFATAASNLILHVGEEDPVGVTTAFATIAGSVSTAPTAGKVVVVGGVTYTFRVAVTVAGDVKIGANGTASITNLSRAISKSGGSEGVGGDYLVGAANPYVTAAVGSAFSDVIATTLTAIAAGAAGNDIVTTTDEPTYSVSGVTAGGADAESVVVDGVTYTFVADVLVPGDVLMGTWDASMANLTRAINQSGGTEGVHGDYLCPGGVAHPTVQAGDVMNIGGNRVALTALTPGAAGNSLTLATNAPTLIALGGATFYDGYNLPHLTITAVAR